MIRIGIDPGISGAIAAMSEDGTECFGVWDMPVMDRPGKVNKQQVDGAALADLLREIHHDRHDALIAVVEHVQSMANHGVTSSFNFGESFGVIKGVCQALRVPMHFSRPQAWKKSAGLIGADKDASRTLCIQQFPEVANDLRLKKHHGRADAILIALHGYTTTHARGKAA